eukprot:TRINITY_DN8380_c0_g1_i6.p1 TRINITY_DN8380_c0_g1~~TRINITY_DN8380_c0_g1_i6.p1  ORF type:complete len:136 (+),score=21.83 TRINITY_DN8380_c0_g1_i6:228-635(+)
MQESLDHHHAMARNLELIHAHIVEAELLSRGQVAVKRAAVRSLEELVTAARAVVSMTSGLTESSLSSGLQAAWLEMSSQLLESCRCVLRTQCAQDSAMNEPRWKSMYRTSLRLKPSELNELIDAFEKSESVETGS